jgi:hypothetical protein
MIQLAFDTKFPNIPQPIAILKVRIDDLAARLGLRIDAWEDDLGDIKGFAVIMPSGLWVLLEERQHTIDHMGALGPTIEVLDDQTDVDSLLKEVLSEFGLCDTDVQLKRVKNSDTWT